MLDKLKNDMISAMRSQDKFRLTTLREIKGALELERINKKVEVTENMLTDVVSKQIKMRNESIKEFEKGHRSDLIEKTNQELAILKEFLPIQLKIEEVQKIINSSFAKINPTKPSDIGLIMREVTPLVRGKFDMAQVSEMIKEKLSQL